MDLIESAIQNDFITAADLLSIDADPNEADDIFNVTPLHYCALNDSLEVAILLIHYGAKIDALTLDGLTPLDVAINVGSKKIANYLTEVLNEFSNRTVN